MCKRGWGLVSHSPLALVCLAPAPSQSDFLRYWYTRVHVSASGFTRMYRKFEGTDVTALQKNIMLISNEILIIDIVYFHFS